MKKTISVLAAASLLLTMAGCADAGKMQEYEETVFSCDPDNMLGFSGIYYDEDELIIVFDEDSMDDETYTGGLRDLFEREEFCPNDKVYILTDGDSLVFDADDVNIDGGDFVITIEDDDIDTDEMTGIRIYNGSNEYTIDTDEGILEVLMWGGECSDTFTQEYRSRSDSWSDVEHEFESYPMTTIESEPNEPGTIVPDTVVPDNSGYMIIPYLAEYTESEYGPEYNEYLYGFADPYGNVIYEPQFRSVQYIRELEVYIVSIDEDGLYKFGLISEEGYLVTNIAYDGAFYESGADESDPGHIYLTIYEEGVLHPVSYDMYNMSILPDIAIDESILPFDAPTASLTVCHLGDNGALIENRSDFYPHRVLVDRNTGELLHDFDSSYGSEILFGDLIIECAIGGGVTVYDITGVCLFEDPDAYGVQLTPYKFLMVSNGELHVFDRYESLSASMEIDRNAYVETALGHIAVYENGMTTVYDEDLNTVITAGNYNVDDGYCPGRYSDEYYDGFYFVSFGNDEITNLITGDSMPVDEGYFYSYEDGRIIADNRGDGNSDYHGWRVYDESFDLLLESEGTQSVIRDYITGEYYILSCNDGVTSVYSLDTCELLFETEGNYGYYVGRVYDGTFALTDMEQFIFIDTDGQIIFTAEIS